VGLAGFPVGFGNDLKAKDLGVEMLGTGVVGTDDGDMVDAGQVHLELGWVGLRIGGDFADNLAGF
jgi:hypothetical protein